MEYFSRKIDGSDSDQEFTFECYQNTHTIEIGDFYLFSFAGMSGVCKCINENEKFEINENNLVSDGKTIDFVTGFWRNCRKIKSTNFDLSNV